MRVSISKQQMQQNSTGRDNLDWKESFARNAGGDLNDMRVGAGATRNMR